ncbi:MAG: molybdate ABC transporter permease subunit [Planctomycetota bacterium]
MDFAAIMSAVGLSMLCASAAVGLCLIPGVGLALLLARKDFGGKGAVELIVMLPVVVPPVVTGYVLLKLLGSSGPLGGLLPGGIPGVLPGGGVVFTWVGAAIAQAVVAFPFLVLTLRVAFAGVDRDLERVAHTFGAGRWRTFWSVTLPLSWHGLAAGCLLAFARALGEFGATIIVAGNIEGQTRTLPLAIYAALQSPGGDATAMGLAVIAVGLAFAALGLRRLFGGAGPRW